MRTYRLLEGRYSPDAGIRSRCSSSRRSQTPSPQHLRLPQDHPFPPHSLRSYHSTDYDLESLFDFKEMGISKVFTIARYRHELWSGCITPS